MVWIVDTVVVAHSSFCHFRYQYHGETPSHNISSREGRTQLFLIKFFLQLILLVFFRFWFVIRGYNTGGDWGLLVTTPGEDGWYNICRFDDF